MTRAAWRGEKCVALENHDSRRHFAPSLPQKGAITCNKIVETRIHHLLNFKKREKAKNSA